MGSFVYASSSSSSQNFFETARAGCSKIVPEFENSHHYNVSRDHVLDDLRRVLVDRGLIDIFGNPTSSLEQIQIPELSETVKKRVYDFCYEPRKVSFENVSGEMYEFEYTLKDLIEYIKRFFGYAKSYEVVGGAVLTLLGEGFFKEYLNVLGVDSSYLSDDFVEKLSKTSNDQDLRFYFPGLEWEKLESLGTITTCFLTDKLAEKYNHNPNESLYQFVRSHVFYKLFHFPRQPEMLKQNSLLHNFTLSLKDNAHTEICLTERISRKHLFLQDALAIDFMGPLFGQSNIIHLKSDLSSLHSALICRVLGVVDADSVKDINHMGWPLYISQIILGKICLKDDVERELTQTFSGKLFTNEVFSLSVLIKKVYENHHCFDVKEDFQSVYVLNALTVSQRHLSIDEFNHLKREILADLTILPDKTIFNILAKLLKSEQLSFSLLSAFIQLFVLNIYIDEKNNEARPTRVAMRDHCGAPALQMTISEGEQNFTLLQPLNLASALMTIKSQMGVLSLEVLEDLGQLYAFMKPGSSEVCAENSFRNHRFPPQVDVKGSLQHVNDLFVVMAEPLHHFIYDLFVILNHVEHTGFGCKQFISRFPAYLDFCNTLDQRERLFQMLLQYLGWTYGLSSLNNLKKNISKLALRKEFSNNQFLEGISFLLLKTERSELFSTAFAFFKFSGSDRLRLFVTNLLPGGIDVACTVLKYSIDQPAISLDKIFRSFSKIMEIPLLNSEQVNDLSDTLLVLFRRNDPQIDMKFIPIALSFIEKIGININTALSDVVLSRAYKTELKPSEHSCFLKLWESYFSPIIQNGSNSVLKKLMKDYGEGEISEDVIFRCRLSMINNKLKANAPLSREVFEQFIALVEVDSWSNYKAEIITCFDSIMQKGLSQSSSKRQECSNNSLISFYTNPVVEKIIDSAPNFTFKTVFDLIEKLSSSEKRNNLHKLIAVYFLQLVNSQVTETQKIKSLSTLIEILESQLPNPDLKNVLAPYVGFIVHLIRVAEQPEMLIQFFNICDTFDILKNDAADNLNGCLWALERGLETKYFQVYVKIMRRLFVHLDSIIVTDQAKLQRFFSVVFEREFSVSTPQECIFWLSQLARSPIEFFISPEAVIDHLHMISTSQDMKAKKKVWPFVAEVFEKKGVFKNNPRGKEKIYLIASRCLKQCDAEACFELLPLNSPVTNVWSDHHLTKEFIEEFYINLFKGVLQGINSPLEEGYLQKFKVLLACRKSMLLNYSSASDRMIELDALMFEKFSSCDDAEYHQNLWMCFVNIHMSPALSSARIVRIYHALVNKMQQFICSASDTFFVNFEFISKNLLNKYLKDIDLPLIINTLSSPHYGRQRMMSIIILLHINSLVNGVNKAFNFDPLRKPIEKLINILISNDSFLSVDQILSIPFVKGVLNDSPKQCSSHNSSSSTKKRRQKGGQRHSSNTSIKPPVTTLQSLRFALFDKMISMFSSIKKYDDHIKSLFIAIMNQIPYLIGTTLELKSFQKLFNAMFVVAENHRNLETFNQLIDRFFEIIIKNIFDIESIIINDVSVSGGAACSSSSSSSSSSDLSNEVLVIEQSSNYFLKKIMQKGISEEFSRSRMKYFSCVIHFARKLFTYETTNSELEAFNQNIAYQIFKYIIENFRDQIAKSEILDMLYAYFVKSSLFTKESTFRKHRLDCTHLIQLYADYLKPSVHLNEYFSLVVIDPKLLLKLRYRPDYHSGLDYTLEFLSKIKSTQSLAVTLEILKLSVVDIFEKDQRKCYNLLGQVFNRCKECPNLIEEGLLKLLIEVFFPNAKMTPLFKSQIYKLQRTLLSWMLQKQFYTSFSQEAQKIHFELCVSFIIKQYVNGGVFDDLYCFKLSLIGLKNFLFIFKDNEDDFKLLKAKVDIMVACCSKPLNVDTSCQKQLLGIIRDTLESHLN